MPFLVQSFDFGGSSHVSLHCCTFDFPTAFFTYQSVVSSHEEYNRRQDEAMAKGNGGCKVIVDLVFIDEKIQGTKKGFPLFFSNPGDNTSEFIRILTNN